MKILNMAKLEFLPRSADAGLLILRAWSGLSMLVLHGWGKMINFNQVAANFPALVGTSRISLALAVFAEVVCAVLLTLGLFTRFAALNLLVTMSIAFFVVHGGALSGEQSGELAFIYLATYVTLLVAGGGRFGLDAVIGTQRHTTRGHTTV
jgi:putative oxidoreductase